MAKKTIGEKMKPRIALLLVSIPFFANAASELSPKQNEVTAYFKSNEEKTVFDAVWTSSSMFKVGRYDNGTSQNGYAQYVCEVLREHGVSAGNSVQVIDIVKLSRDSKWVKLGEAHCK